MDGEWEAALQFAMVHSEGDSVPCESANGPDRGSLLPPQVMSEGLNKATREFLCHSCKAGLVCL